MILLFTRGKQTAKRFGLFIFEKLYYPRLCFLLKTYENNGNIIISKPTMLYLVR